MKNKKVDHVIFEKVVKGQILEGLEGGVIYFRNCFIKTDQIVSINTSRHIVFVSCHIEKLIIYKSSFAEILFEGQSHIHELQIHNCTFQIVDLGNYEIPICKLEVNFSKGEILFNQGTIINLNLNNNHELILKLRKNDSKLKFWIGILSIKGRLDFEFSEPKIDVLRLTDSSIKIDFQPVGIKSIYIINPLEDINLYSAELEKLHLEGANNKTIHLSNLLLNKLHLKNFINLGVCKIMNVGNGTSNMDEVIIEGCNLDKVVFQNLNFINSDSFQINKTLLLNTSFNYVEWPDRFEGSDRDLSEIYRDLKTVYSNKKDIVNELKFKVLEYETHRNREDITSMDRFIFRTNYYSNRNGQDFVYPILWLININLIIFLLYTLIDFRVASDWGVFVQLFNPVRSLNYIEECPNLLKWKNLIVFIDLLSRILTSYFIFQTVFAFRKFSR